MIANAQSADATAREARHQRDRGVTDPAALQTAARAAVAAMAFAAWGGN